MRRRSRCQTSRSQEKTTENLCVLCLVPPTPFVSHLFPLDVSRLRYVNKFVSDVVQVATKLRPLPDRPVEEVRETFATKLELSMKLAISKYKPIQV